MDSRRSKWKFNGKMTKDKWILLLAVGVILMILSFPSGKGFSLPKTPAPGGPENQDKAGGNLPQESRSVEAAARAQTDYEAGLEARVKEILKHVDGVGQVDVMIVLKSSEEKVIRVDKNTSVSTTMEQDASGGTRQIDSQDLEESTVLTGAGGDSAPFIEKEIKPEISGIIISATGGGSPAVKAEISAAMEALFGIPPHKIKVLKRVE